MAVDSGAERGQQDPDEFEHAGGIADTKSLQLLVRPFAPLHLWGEQSLSVMPVHRKGKIVIPNGTPRAGKSSIASAIQARFPTASG